MLLPTSAALAAALAAVIALLTVDATVVQVSAIVLVLGAAAAIVRRSSLARHRLADSEYRLGQLRYDLAKLRAKGLVERLGRTRRYRLTPLGLRLGILLVKLRLRLLGPLGSLAADPVRRPGRPSNAVEAAFRQVNIALDQLCDSLGLVPAA